VLILIPFYVLMTNLGLVDTRVGLILTHTSITLPVKWGMITAGTVVAIVPTIVFFSIVQRRLVAGLTAGAVK
jgi:ABC-type glycerol-3-phosphate transport system permease component